MTNSTSQEKKAHQKVVLITGAAQRLGAHTTRHLHQQGWRILLHCRHSRESADSLATELNAQRDNSCHVLQADLDQYADIQRLANEAIHKWQQLDALINNASSFYPTAIGETTEHHWNALFSSNAKAPFFLAQALQPALAKQQGCIINMLDIHAKSPLQSHTVYCMAKAALAMMTLSLAKELAPQIRVNAIAPGAILWPSTHTPDETTQARILAEIPMERLGTPQDIARTIAFLLDDAPYITGQIIGVDGGRGLG
jgi:pteridine reductase